MSIDRFTDKRFLLTNLKKILKLLKDCICRLADEARLRSCTFLIDYIIQFVFFYPQNYISFLRQRILFPEQRKYFDSKRIAFETAIL